MPGQRKASQFKLCEKGHYGKNEKDHQARNAARHEAEAHSCEGSPSANNRSQRSRCRLTRGNRPDKDED